MNMEYINNFYSAIKSLNEFDHAEVHNIVSGQLAPSLREKAFTLNYHRAEINVELLLTLTDTRQFQAIAMLARSVFEMAAEIRLILRDPEAGEKIAIFTDLEKLRSAKQILRFKSSVSFLRDAAGSVAGIRSCKRDPAHGRAGPPVARN